MTQSYFIAVCSLGKNSNLDFCIKELLRIRQTTSHKVEVLLVLNRFDNGEKFDKGLLVCYEPIQGYSSVRNKAISMLPDNANVIFFDDDEIPTLSWLDEMIRMHERFPSDVIFGAVLPNENSNELSFRNLMMRKYEGLLDGQTVKQAGIGNMLIPNSLIAKDFFYFDLVFNISGSEDTDLCFRLRRNQVSIRFARGAFVYENQPRERFDQKYIDQRRIKDISNYSLVIRRNLGMKAIIWRFFISLIRVMLFGFMSVFKRKYLVETRAHFNSLKVLIKGEPSLM